MDNPLPESRFSALFLLNPHAGLQPVNFIVSRDLDRRTVNYLKTDNIDEARKQIEKYKDDHNVFVAAGGDGTVHSVAEELVGTDKILGVLPLGSGNGFAREFGFRMNIRSLLSEIEKGESMDIDVIEVNGKMCLNVAGIGLDSFVAHSFHELKMRGFLPYIWLTIKTFLRLKPFHAIVTIGGKKAFEGELFVLTLANTRQFGNNAFIAPGARPDDGKIELVLIRPFPKIFGASMIARLFSKTIHHSRYVRTITTEEEITIESNETRLHIDGEPYEMQGKVVVKINREALKVLKTTGNKFLPKD